MKVKAKIVSISGGDREQRVVLEVVGRKVIDEEKKEKDPETGKQVVVATRGHWEPAISREFAFEHELHGSWCELSLPVKTAPAK